MNTQNKILRKKESLLDKLAMLYVALNDERVRNRDIAETLSIVAIIVSLAGLIIFLLFN